MTLHVRDGGVWKQAVPYVRDGGVWKPAQLYVRDAGVWKLVAGGPTGPVSVSINPTSGNAIGDTAGNTFPACTVTVTGGAASSYTWGFTSIAGGAWTVNSGQGTATAAPRVASVNFGSSVTATFYCDVVVSGMTYRVTAPHEYYRNPA